MRHIGFIRRIDELGRIVIPKEIRKNLRIKSGDNLEIGVNDDKIVLEKYSEIKNFMKFCNKYAPILSNSLKCVVLICDTDGVLATYGGMKNCIGKRINSEFFNKRELLFSNEVTFEDYKVIGNFIVSPIISEGDVIGFLVAYREEDFLAHSENMIKLFTQILGKYVEN